MAISIFCTIYKPYFLNLRKFKMETLSRSYNAKLNWLGSDLQAAHDSAFIMAGWATKGKLIVHPAGSK